MRISRGARWGAGIGALVVFAVAVGVGFSPFVRSRILAESRRRGFDVTVDRVQPGWMAVRLIGVRGRLPGVDGLEADFESATIELSPWLTPREAVFADGRVSAKGDTDRLRTQIAAWRAARPQAARGGDHTGLAVRTERTTVQWENGATVLSIDGLALERNDTGVRARIASATIRRDTLTMSAEAAAFELDASYNLSRARIVSAEVAWSIPARPTNDAAPVTSSSATDLAPPPLPTPLPVGRPRSRKPPSIRDEPPSAEVVTPLVPLPDLHVLRASAAALASALATRLPEGSVLAIDGPALRLQRGTEDRLSLGPGPLKVERRASTLDMTFSTAAGAAGTPMSVHEMLPSNEGDVEVSLSGGPVSLSLL